MEINRVFARVLLYIATFCIPSIPLFGLYNNNRTENILFFNQIVLAGVVFSVIGLLIFFIFKLITSEEGALLLTLLFWAVFWMYEALFGIVLRYFDSITYSGFLFLSLAVIVLAVVLLRKYNPPFSHARPFFNILSICAVLLLVVNVVPGVNEQRILVQARGEHATTGDGVPFYFKQTFVVDPTAPMPNIYWLHVDGAMNLGTVERHWGEDTDRFRQEFESRGFLIYEEARLNAGNTWSALPALLSPGFYDSFWGEQMANSTGFRNEKSRNFRAALANVGLTVDDMNENHELFTALVARGYDIQIVGTLSGRVPRNIEQRAGLYTYVLTPWHRFIENTGDLTVLLSITSALNFPAAAQRVEIGDTHLGHNDSDVGTGNFVWTTFNYAHMYYGHRSVPGLPHTRTEDMHVYPTMFNFALTQALDFIDATLEENPDAIFVVQADHGFHMPETQRAMVRADYSPELIDELMHSIFSAVRIPQSYGGLEAPLRPVNITRELVNRFVGENYTLLP